MRCLYAAAFLVIALSVTCTSAWAHPLVTGERLQGTVQGAIHARNSSGYYINLYWVTVTASNAKHNFTTSTDENGFYSFSLPIGTYNVTVQAGFHVFVCYAAFVCSRTLRANVTVDSGSIRFVEFDFTWNSADDIARSG